MNRKSMAWVCAMLVCVLIALPGCKKKKPAMPAEAMPTPQPAEQIADTEPPPLADPTPDPWDAEIEELNRMAWEQGLLGDVYYAYDQYELRPEARQRLASNADFMKQHPTFQFLIEGHCDERGTNEYNLALGDRRATAARNYLMSLGVEAERLRTISYGEERPQCRDASEGCWQTNRRAHFMITARNVG